MDKAIKEIAIELAREISKLLSSDLPGGTKVIKYEISEYPSISRELITTRIQFGENHTLSMTIERPTK